MIAIICAVVFFVGILFVGILAGRKVSSASQWANGGMSLTWVTVGILLVTFQIGGTSIMGAAQNGYLLGIAGVWYALASSIAIFLTSFFARALRKHIGGETLTDYLSKRYTPRVGGIYSTIYLLMGFIYIPIQLFTLTTIIQTLMPGVNLTLACIIGLVLSVSYIVVSGIQGAGYVGKVSAILMYATLFVCLFMMLGKTGGFANLTDNLPKSYFSLGSMSTFTWFSWILTFFVQYLTMQAAVQPTLSSKSEKDAAWGIRFAAIINIPCGIICTLIGMICKTQMDLGENSSLAFATSINEYIPGWLTGLTFAGIALIIVCTLANQMLAIGTVIRQVLTPVYKKQNFGEKKELLFTRGLTFLYALFTIIPTFAIQRSLLNQLVTIVIACVSCPVFFSIIGGIYWKRMNTKAAFWSIITGIAAGIIWVLIGMSNKYNPAYIILPVSIIVGFVIAKLTPEKKDAQL